MFPQTPTTQLPVECLPTPSDIASLFKPLKLGSMRLTTRVVYAPLARRRALGSVPSCMACQYYSGAAPAPAVHQNESTSLPWLFDLNVRHIARMQTQKPHFCFPDSSSPVFAALLHPCAHAVARCTAATLNTFRQHCYAINCV